MSKRTILAAGLLVVWAGVLGWHVKREYFPARSTLLTRGARGIPPGPAYYRLTWDGRRLGWARVQLDTVPGGGFRLGTLLEMEAGALGASGALRAQTTTRLGADLTLDRFEARATGSLLAGLAGGGFPTAGEGAPRAGGPASGQGTIRARGRVVAADSTLIAVLERNGRSDTVRVPTAGGLVPVGALPLHLAADPNTGPGRRVGVRLLDPRSASVREVDLRVSEAAIRSYPDSARRDPTTGRWVAARRDTVRAWRVTPAEGGLPVTAWVDEDGRLLEARVGSALRLERTAFELAYVPLDSAGAARSRSGLPRPDAGGMP